MPGFANQRSTGFTLTEVAFAMAIMLAAVVTVLLLLGVSLRSQQRSRMGTHAAAVAISLMERFQQDSEDMRSRQDYNTPFSRASVYNKDGSVQGWERRADNFVGGNGAHFMTAGQFDLETRLMDGRAIIPIPTAIARRLDSPGDAIGRMLDAGGRLYYVNPTQAEGASTTRMAGNRETGDDTRRLVVGVIGSAQQNTLPNHPFVLPPRMLYPFPPLGMHYSSMGRHMFLRRWEQREIPPTPLFFNGQSFTAGDLCAANAQSDNRNDPFNNSFGGQNQSRLSHGSSWDEQAYFDELNGLSASSSRWRAGLPEFWRLVNHHWSRIYFQLRSNTYESGNTTVKEAVYQDVSRTITEKVVTYDRFRNPTFSDVTRTVTEKVQVGEIDVVRSAGANEVRGVPSPPLGLPLMQGARGSDILYEDAETLAKDRWNQMRVGLPGLERRVMYRTAALALWGKVDGHGSIAEVGLDELADFSEKGSPSIVRAAALPTARNPLLSDLPLPANPRDIHATQVLALSYLAHAATLVTGYKPPFVNERNSMEANQHVNLVPDEDAPYKNPIAGDFYLFHPFYRGSDATTFRVSRSEFPSDVAAIPLSTATVTSTDPRIARDMDGNPITYKRVDGPVVNPFPGPYADRGAFDWRGVAAWSRNPATLRISSHGTYPTGAGFSSADPSDTMMARIATENALRWAMAYVRENPYDQIVPKPYNSPTATDRPLYAFNLFDGSGNALRKPAAWNNANLYSVLWGTDRAVWPQQLAGVGRNWSLWLWTNDRFNTYTTNPIRAQTNGGSAIGTGEYHDVLTLGDVALNRYNKFDRGHSRTYRNDGGFSDTGGDLSAWNGYTTGYDATVSLGTPISSAIDQRLRMNASPQRSRWWYDKQFSVADRTRQLVFWAVDWQAFEDAESQASEPVDLSYWNLVIGGPDIPGGTGADRVLRGAGHPETSLMWANPARDGKNSDPPQSNVVLFEWKYDGNGTMKYRDMRSNHLGSGVGFTNILYDPGDYYPWSRVGTWGADRNANGVWDRGRVPANSRMKAEEVARFPFYDPIMWTTLGN